MKSLSQRNDTGMFQAFKHHFWTLKYFDRMLGSGSMFVFMLSSMLGVIWRKCRMLGVLAEMCVVSALGV